MGGRKFTLQMFTSASLTKIFVHIFHPYWNFCKKKKNNQICKSLMRQTGIFQGGWEAARQWIVRGHFLVYVFKIMLKVLDLSVLEHIFFAVLLKRVKRGPLLPRSFLATLLILERFRTPGTIWWQGFALLTTPFPFYVHVVYGWPIRAVLLKLCKFTFLM